MGQNTHIQWSDHTFNPWWGCTRVSPGCQHCYAAVWAQRFGYGWGPLAEHRTFGAKHWNEPVKWNRRAGQHGVRERVFCGSMCDVFENHPTANGLRGRLFNLIAGTPHLDWLLLTKRPENISLSNEWLQQHRNVWLGVTAEDQQRADERIPLLLQHGAAVRFVSVEPMLGAVDLSKWLNPDGAKQLRRWLFPEFDRSLLDWVICGGESGPRARPMDLDWVRALRDQCVAAGVPFFFKQMKVGKQVVSIPELDGQQWHQVPGV